VPIAIASPHPHQMPSAMELFALKHEIKMTLCVAPMRIAFGNPVAAIPDHHRTAAVFAFRDRAFECVVFDRVVLDVNGQALFRRVKARATGHRPALHHAIEFEPEIVMQPPRPVLLNHIAIASTATLAAARLCRDAEFALLAIDFESHAASICAIRDLGPTKTAKMPHRKVERYSGKILGTT